MVVLPPSLLREPETQGVHWGFVIRSQLNRCGPRSRISRVRFWLMKWIIPPLAAFGAAFVAYQATYGAESGIASPLAIIVFFAVFGIAANLLSGDD